MFTIQSLLFKYFTRALRIFVRLFFVINSIQTKKVEQAILKVVVNDADIFINVSQMLRSQVKSLKLFCCYTHCEGRNICWIWTHNQNYDVYLLVSSWHYYHNLGHFFISPLLVCQLLLLISRVALRQTSQAQPQRRRINQVSGVTIPSEARGRFFECGSSGLVK